MCFVQSGQSGDGYVSGAILGRYSWRNGDLFVRSWASVLRMFFGSLCSESFMGGGMSSISLLWFLFSR